MVTATVDRVRDVWRDVLGTEAFGDDEKFFDLGGNSVLLSRLFDRLQEAFRGVELSFVELFEYTTCSEIATVIESRSGTASVIAVNDV